MVSKVRSLAKVSALVAVAGLCMASSAAQAAFLSITEPGDELSNISFSRDNNDWIGSPTTTTSNEVFTFSNDIFAPSGTAGSWTFHWLESSGGALSDILDVTMTALSSSTFTMNVVFCSDPAFGSCSTAAPAQTFIEDPAGATFSMPTGLFNPNLQFLVIMDPSVEAPEPASLALLGMGLAGLGFGWRRRAS